MIHPNDFGDCFVRLALWVISDLFVNEPWIHRSHFGIAHDFQGVVFAFFKLALPFNRGGSGCDFCLHLLYAVGLFGNDQTYMFSRSLHYWRPVWLAEVVCHLNVHELRG